MTSPPTNATCPRCGQPGVVLTYGRLVRHVIPTRPRTKCAASGLQPADAA